MVEQIKRLLRLVKNNIQESRLKKAKLGITYCVFNGEEILPFSLKSIREDVDYINVVYQRISWTGTECDPNLVSNLNNLKDKGLIDNVIEYVMPESCQDHKRSKLVIEKKNVGLSDLRKHGCTHCMIMDTDELYIPEEFKAAKKFIIENGITHSACPLYDYRYYPEIRSRDAASFAVPFIFKIKCLSSLAYNHHMPCKVDSLRTLKYNKWVDKFYFLNSICMHHMTGLRFNYNNKLDSTITNFAFYGPSYIEEVKKKDAEERKLSMEELLNSYDNYIKVNNRFNIHF